jgi:hypothetical protein
MKKIVFDYAMLMEYKEWDEGYDLDMMYNSVMLSGDIDDNLTVTAGSVIRADSPSPLGFSLGVSIKTNWIRTPRLWAHIAYGMDPYEDNNYTLYRADDPLNKPIYRTYLLNRLDEEYSNNRCRISIGLIWEL